MLSFFAIDSTNARSWLVRASLLSAVAAGVDEDIDDIVDSDGDFPQVRGCLTKRSSRSKENMRWLEVAQSWLKNRRRLWRATNSSGEEMMVVIKPLTTEEMW